MLCQIEVVATSEDIFSDYAYFSSFSTSWLEHASAYVDLIVPRLGLGPDSLAVEIASNDGYLLQYMQRYQVPCLGVEPAGNVAQAARAKGIETEVAFWGVETAERLKAAGREADLIIGNNVLAHVPTLNDFVAGLQVLLKPNGVVTMEFPHLYRLVDETQFDTIYHEHFSYFALFVVRRIFAHHGLRVFDVDELPTHGGSLRIYACHADNDGRPDTENIEAVLAKERQAGLDGFPAYERFAADVAKVKEDLLAFLQQAKAEGKRVLGYGAPAKGNTLLNYCGVGTDLIDYTVDLSPYKQGHFLPGSHLPIQDRELFREDKPDYVLILPWNLREEIMGQMAHVREWGGKFVTPIPRVQVWE